MKPDWRHQKDGREGGRLQKSHRLLRSLFLSILPVSLVRQRLKLGSSPYVTSSTLRELQKPAAGFGLKAEPLHLLSDEK